MLIILWLFSSGYSLSGLQADTPEQNSLGGKGRVMMILNIDCNFNHENANALNFATMVCICFIYALKLKVSFVFNFTLTNEHKADFFVTVLGAHLLHHCIFIRDGLK